MKIEISEIVLTKNYLGKIETYIFKFDSETKWILISENHNFFYLLEVIFIKKAIQRLNNEFPLGVINV